MAFVFRYSSRPTTSCRRSGNYGVAFSASPPSLTLFHDHLKTYRSKTEHLPTTTIRCVYSGGSYRVEYYRQQSMFVKQDARSSMRSVDRPVSARPCFVSACATDTAVLAIYDKLSDLLPCDMASGKQYLLHAGTTIGSLSTASVPAHEQQKISGLHRKMLLAVGRRASG